MSVVTKSSLTGAVGLSLSGGYFPTELKLSGYDALVITGKAEKPVYLWIDNSDVAIGDATGLWGLSTFDKQFVEREA
jgi:aldehyde:ferredoxin oxidoreductase